MSNKIWYLPGPFHQYREDVKALAKEHGLRIIDASITESREGEADDVPEVTVRQVEPAPVLLIADSNDGAALQELIDKLNAERDGIVLLIDAAEGLSDLEHPGAGELPIRLFGALKAIHEGFESLTGERDSLAGEVESLRAEVERLKAAAEPADSAEKIASLKAQLDAAKVPYRANASVESLEKAVAELPKA
ncbi:hypothetical protein DXT77_15640 [Pseudomonas sp. 91RF]|jgi:hypothetical protein|uniref:hypothetical protein n=1 Tax=Pseudomonas sp. 91RF TaxID=2292261 RepID=UPI000E66542F|nr:hypothetical protein [Pseudomonas sp. 91RF]RIJ09873.1 hypothetical protein DXT77_15640 [Pseudomonas sp. 91RF]